MKSLSMLLSTVFLMIAPAAIAAPEVGKTAPDFTATNTQGKEVKLHKIEGIKVLEWTNHECPFVKKHYNSNNMQMLQADAKEKGITWISIISSAEGKQGYVSAEEANTIASEKKAMPAHIILDTKGSIGKSYDAKTTPHMYVIDKDNTLIYMGAIDSNNSANPADVNTATNYVKLAMDAAVKGTTPETTATSPYGCGVKY